MQRDSNDYDCLELLPMVAPGEDLGHGSVVYDDKGLPVVACFAFMTVGVGICWFERFVSRPDTPTAEGRDAAAICYAWLERYVHALGYGLVYAHCCRPGMAREAEKLGFVRQGGAMIEMAKVIEPSTSWDLSQQPPH